MNQDELNAEVLECARYGEVDDLRELLVAGAEVNHKDSDGNTALHKGITHNCDRDVFYYPISTEASANGEIKCLAVLKELVESDWAVQNNQVESTKFLLQNFDIDVLTKNSYGRSVLTDAFQSGNSEIIDICLAHPSASEERLIPSEPMSGNGFDCLKQEDGVLIGETDPSEHAVVHRMNFQAETDTIISIRELPITRADYPFGSSDSPEDDSTAVYGRPAEVYITDIHAPALHNASFNVLLNGFAPEQTQDIDLPPPPATTTATNSDVMHSDGMEIDSEPSTFTSSSGDRAFLRLFSRQIDGRCTFVTVKSVSWQDETTYPRRGAFVDVLLGSDLVYDDAAASTLALVAGVVLNTGGSLLYVAPDSGRAGLDGLVGALDAHGLQCVGRSPCPPEFYSNPLCSGESDDDSFLLHFMDLAIHKPYTLFHFVKS